MGFNQSSEVPSEKLDILLGGISSWQVKKEEVPF
jgi:hypothetical protein